MSLSIIVIGRLIVYNIIKTKILCVLINRRGFGFNKRLHGRERKEQKSLSDRIQESEDFYAEYRKMIETMPKPENPYLQLFLVKLLVKTL